VGRTTFQVIYQVVRGITTGSRTLPTGALKASGRSDGMRMCHISQIRNGRIASLHCYYDLTTCWNNSASSLGRQRRRSALSSSLLGFMRNSVGDSCRVLFACRTRPFLEHTDGVEPFEGAEEHHFAKRQAKGRLSWVLSQVAGAGGALRRPFNRHP